MFTTWPGEHDHTANCTATTIDSILLMPQKGSPYSITERRVPELIPVLGSQPAGDLSHKPGGRLPLRSARPAVTPQPLRRLLPILLLGEQRHNGCERHVHKTVTKQRRGCDLNLSPSAPESSTLTTRLPSYPLCHNTLKSKVLPTTRWQKPAGWLIGLWFYVSLNTK